jgi:hypothetical protein
MGVRVNICYFLDFEQFLQKQGKKGYYGHFGTFSYRKFKKKNLGIFLCLRICKYNYMGCVKNIVKIVHSFENLFCENMFHKLLLLSIEVK